MRVRIDVGIDAKEDALRPAHLARGGVETRELGGTVGAHEADAAPDRVRELACGLPVSVQDQLPRIVAGVERGTLFDRPGWLR